MSSCGLRLLCIDTGVALKYQVLIVVLWLAESSFLVRINITVDHVFLFPLLLLEMWTEVIILFFGGDILEKVGY